MYKTIKPVLEHIDNLAQSCGMFTTKNGTYGCKSKWNHKQEPGCCYAFDCPLASVADLEDLKNHDAILYEQYKNGDEITDWVVQYRKIKFNNRKRG